MIKTLLQELRNTRVPLSVAALSQRLHTDPSALEGMLFYCVQKGHILENGQLTDVSHTGADCGSCVTACTGLNDCPFIARMPRMYSIKLSETREKK